MSILLRWISIRNIVRCTKSSASAHSPADIGILVLSLQGMNKNQPLMDWCNANPKLDFVFDEVSWLMPFAGDVRGTGWATC